MCKCPQKPEASLSSSVFGLSGATCRHCSDGMAACEGFFPGAAIEGRYTEVTPRQALTVRAELLRRDFNFGDSDSTLNLRSQLAPLPDAQPHIVVAGQRGGYEYLECPVILFSDEGEIFSS